MKWIKCTDRLPPDCPVEDEFETEYEIKYLQTDGLVGIDVTEWREERSWNCMYPVIAWREYRVIIPFDRDYKEI